MMDQESDGYGDSESLLLQGKKQQRGYGDPESLLLLLPQEKKQQQRSNGVELGSEGKFKGSSSNSESESRWSRSSTADDNDEEDFMSSLRSLVSVLKSHEESERIWRIKLQALLKRQEALDVEKQKYKRRKYYGQEQCRGRQGRVTEFAGSGL